MLKNIDKIDIFINIYLSPSLHIRRIEEVCNVQRLSPDQVALISQASQETLSTFLQLAANICYVGASLTDTFIQLDHGENKVFVNFDQNGGSKILMTVSNFKLADGKRLDIEIRVSEEE